MSVNIELGYGVVTNHYEVVINIVVANKKYVG